MASTARVPVAQLADVASKEFDYVIIGGGTSGLALAGRLAEDPNITVAVLEAGGETQKYDLITMPAQFGRQFASPELTYGYMSVPQPTTGRPLFNPRGRGLGGSSAINFMMFINPPAGDVNNWEKLGSPGWNWDRFHAAVKRAETFHSPTPEDAAKFGFEFNPASHGTDGPIHTSYPKSQTAGQDLLKQTFINLGHQSIADPAGGNLLGIGTFPGSIDPRTNTRSYAATGYLSPETSHSNLKVLSYATARRVLFREQATPGAEDLVAEGVEFDCQGSTHRVQAKREVIIAAGTMCSPAILELSGIGDKKILEAAGVAPRVHNTAVGENSQEHIFFALKYELNSEKTGYESLDLLADPEVDKKHRDLYAQGKGLYLTQIAHVAWLPFEKICSSPQRFDEIIAAEEARIAEDLKHGRISEGLSDQYTLQLEHLKRPDLPDVEILFTPLFFKGKTSAEPGKSYQSICCPLTHPFSRGSMHIKSPNPSDPPEMNPRVFDHPIDLELMVEIFKYCRNFAQSEPAKSVLVKEAYPGPEVASDEEIRNYILETCGSIWHTVGTCAMSPRQKSGVVDVSLKVYGTANLRVGDISIVPLHVAAHTQSISYAIAEQLADILKAEARAAA